MSRCPRSPRRSLAHATAAALVLTLVLPGVAGATEQKTQLSILGFTKDAKKMLVDIDDINYGRGLRLYDVETGQPAKRARVVEYERAEKIKTVKRAKRRYKIKDAGLESMKTADEKIAFFSVEKADKLVIACTDYKRLGKITDIPLRVDKDTGEMAQARLKTIMWTSDRKTMVLVVTQKMKGKFVYEKDFFHFVPFKKRKIMWVEPEEKKKKEKKEDKGWWPF